MPAAFFISLEAIMRTELVSPGVGEMTYEIRNIVNVAEKLQKCGVKINWENIGDPIVKGEVIPAWMKEIVAAEAMNNDPGATATPVGCWAHGSSSALRPTVAAVRQSPRMISSFSTGLVTPLPRFTAVSTRRRACWCRRRPIRRIRWQSLPMPVQCRSATG